MALAKALVAAVRGGGPGRAQGKLAGAAAGQEHAEPDGANGAALEAGERYKKIVADTARLDALLVDLFLDCHGSQPERIVLDVDATAGTVEELARGGVCARDRAEPALEAALGRGAGAGPPGVRAHGAGGAGAVRGGVLRAGDMENRIKEQQLALFADRTSAQTLRANQLRLYFASFAYTLLELLRRWGLQGTQLARLRRCRRRNATRSASSCSRSACGSGSACGPCGCRSTRAFRKRVSSAGAGPPPEPTAAQLATALQAIVASPAGARREHCVHRAGGVAEPAATPSLLAALTKHLHGFAAPPYGAMLSSHSKRIKPLRIYDS